MSIETYVAVNGDDTHCGTQKHPFAPLTRARDVLRALPVAERAGSTVWIGGGDYSLTETLRLSTRDGGRPKAPVTWRPMPRVALAVRSRRAMWSSSSTASRRR